MDVAKGESSQIVGSVRESQPSNGRPCTILLLSSPVCALLVMAISTLLTLNSSAQLFLTSVRLSQLEAEIV